MQIALISVAPPFRGGISKHTSILVEHLSKSHTVDLINYKRQYPEFLFPGKTQFLEDTLSDCLGQRLVDSINPFNWFRTGNQIAKKKYDLVIFRFWNPFFSPALATLAGIVKRKSPSTKLISLCDNILPHEKTPMSGFFTSLLFKRLDGHLVQSSQTEKELKEVVPNPLYEKRLHPLYNTLPEKVERSEAKNKFGIKAEHIILYFGLIREYKGFDILLKALAHLIEKRTNIHLLAAGECYEEGEKYRQLIQDLGISEFVTWHDRYIPDENITDYFSAADVAALPYRSASQSGVTQIAYHYDLPVIVTRVGGLPDIVDEEKSGFIINPEDPNQLSDVLDKHLDGNKFELMGEYIKTFKLKFSWNNFVEGIETLYKRV